MSDKKRDDKDPKGGQTADTAGDATADTPAPQNPPPPPAPGQSHDPRKPEGGDE